jgi:hypothetical protein
VRSSELLSVPLPSSHVLIVENESSLHQLPTLADTIAVMGCGLDLEWVQAERLRRRRVGYGGIWIHGDCRCWRELVSISLTWLRS